MTRRSAWTAALLYTGLGCGVMLMILYFLFDANTSPFVRLVGGIAGIGFGVLCGAAMLVAYGEYSAAPAWVWLVYSLLSLSSIIVPTFGHFEQNDALVRLAPLVFAVAMYSYQRLISETDGTN